MAKSRTRDKPYNPRKSKAIAMAEKEKRLRLACAPLAIVFVSGSVMADLYHLKTGEYLDSTLEVDYALRHYPFKWSVFQAAFCAGPEQYMRVSHRVCTTPMTRDEIAEELVEELERLVNGANQAHLRGHGWIACCSGKVLTIDDAERIFAPMNPYRIRTAEEIEADNNHTDVEIAHLVRDQRFKERYS